MFNIGSPFKVLVKGWLMELCRGQNNAWYGFANDRQLDGDGNCP